MVNANCSLSYLWGDAVFAADLRKARRGIARKNPFDRQATDCNHPHLGAIVDNYYLRGGEIIRLLLPNFLNPKQIYQRFQNKCHLSLIVQ